MRLIKFKFAPRKALAAIHWMVQRKSGVDLHTLLKACYFADKEHLNKYGRPIFGATYRAMPFGPVPLEIYEMAKGEVLWLASLSAERYPWEIRGYRLFLKDNNGPNLSVLSETDMEELETAFKRSADMDFSTRTAATHGPDWQAAELGIMRYEDMLEDMPGKDEKLAYLRETSRFMRL